ncbi:MAG: monofunctional biosynthetic peptidoglycan transglycosylase [Myxococcota bacterium]
MKKRKRVRTVVLLLVAGMLAFAAVDYLRLPSVAALKELAKTRPKTTALMELRKEQAATQGKKYAVRSSWIALRDISEHLVHAVITTEDGGFFQHEGVDWEELKVSVQHDIEEGEALRGASTITQQLAKNLYLNPSRSPLRKLREMVIAHRLEESLSKTRILELYLNLIEWGPGVYGCELAAQNAFAKSAAELTREEAAALAAVIASPLKHRANNETDRFVTRRTSMILGRMDGRGW